MKTKTYVGIADSINYRAKPTTKSEILHQSSNLGQIFHIPQDYIVKGEIINGNPYWVSLNYLRGFAQPYRTYVSMVAFREVLNYKRADISLIPIEYEDLQNGKNPATFIRE